MSSSPSSKPSSTKAVPLTISERFDATNEIAEKLIKDEPNLTRDAALERAQSIEFDLHKNSSSPDYYRSSLSIFCNSAGGGTSGLESAYEDEGRLFRGLEMRIAEYPSCYFYQSGRSSDIFVSKAKIGSNHSGLVALKVSVSALAPHDHMREARILRKVGNGNEHVVQVLETFKRPETGGFVLVMPFYRHTLADFVESGFQDQKSLKRIFKQVLSAMDYIHTHDVIHRDIKGSNILLRSPEGPACLCDFGIAWSLEDHDVDEPEKGKVIEIGTTCYRPPETLFGYQSYGVEVDLWAFGCVVAEMELHSSLFDAGDLGSELALLASIFQTLGTPDQTIWPEAKNCPDFGKMTFKDFPAKSWNEILPNSDDATQDLVAHLVNYSQARRLSAAEALNHAYFKGI